MSTLVKLIQHKDEEGQGSTKTLNPVGQRQQKAGNMEERYI